ncbi:MAG: hypothetical protein JWO53_1222 [Chlamydiia bacterium]|nr:hypothetical protein [Chlamydiia bacterium]
MKKLIYTFLLLITSISPLFASDALYGTSSGTKKTDRYFALRDIRIEMARKINDIERVNGILKAYTKLWNQVRLTQKEWDLFEQWMCEKLYFLGSKYYNHDLVYIKLPSLTKNRQFKAAYKQFIASIASQPIASLTNGNKKNITILYNGSAGGGHKAPAVALCQHFEKNGHVVQLIDVDTYINRRSPKVEGLTRAQIYGEIFQKQGNPRKAHKLRLKIEARHIPKNRKFMADLKKEIVNFSADHIFAVAHHHPEYSYLSFQLGVPMTFVHTDHIFNKSLVPLVKEQMKLEKHLLNFTALSNYKSFYKNIYEALRLSRKELPSSIRKQMARLDFPVRPSFHPVTNEKMQQIREAFEIPSDAIVCKVAMGQNGVTREIQKLIKRMVEEERMLTQPLYVFVVCGKNAELKNMLEAFVKKHVKKNSFIRIDIRGFLHEQEMAQIDQISNVWITKPGGSTSAELVQTQKQMLYVYAPTHSWEQTNAEYLKKLKLAEALSTDKSIIKQIKKRNEAYTRVNPNTLPGAAWQEQALRIVNK